MNLTQKQMQAIKAILVDGDYSDGESINIVATLRAMYKCDNHQVHKMYSEQLNRRDNAKEDWKI